MLNWEYSGDPNSPNSRIPKSHQFAQARLPWMACTGTSCWLRHCPSLKSMFGNIRCFAEQALRHNADGMLNTDWGDCGHRSLLGNSLLAFAYGAAHAWNSAGTFDDTFPERFYAQYLGHKQGKIARAVRLMDAAASDGDHNNLYLLPVEPPPTQKPVLLRPRHSFPRPIPVVGKRQPHRRNP